MLNTAEFTYDLPPERIAAFPLDIRDQSKLLIYDKGEITHGTFRSIANHLLPDSILYFNDTKVIAARLLFQKTSGSTIEIFLLNPVAPSTLVLQAMQERRTCVWKCKIGNLKRWKEQSLEKQTGTFTLNATLVDREEGIVCFSWSDGYTFAEIINLTGETPLPPYIKRKAEETDRARYQTIYSQHDGAVAAPTAGLHFTEDVFKSLLPKNIKTDFITLHVSAGTFQPIKTDDAADHVMHQEQIIIHRRNIENLLQHTTIIPVGTTSMRTLESLYWYGVKLINEGDAMFSIDQHYPYSMPEPLPSRKDALTAIVNLMDRDNTDYLIGETSIYILPGYRFRMCEALVTNFHQPGSTLILLVAAFIGDDWKKVYSEALENGYRFLSYGDSSLLIPRPSQAVTL